MAAILSPIHLLIIIVLYLVVLIASIYLILKNEKGYLTILWIVIVLAFPFIGSIIYLAKSLVSTKY